MAVQLANLMAISSWLDTRVLGEATLICVAAVAIGFLVMRIWPKRISPQLFGALAALLFTGGLAYAGSNGAGLALVVLLALGAILGAAALVL